jgi:hypothetical protein
MTTRAWLVLGFLGAVVVPRSSSAADERIAIGEVAVAAAASPPGVDRATLKSAAEGEIRTLDASHVKHKVVVSLSVIGASDAPVAVSVNALVRDGRTGAMIAIIEGRARAEGGGNVELRRAVLRAAVRTAVRQIPSAVSGN